MPIPLVARAGEALTPGVPVVPLKVLVDEPRVDGGVCVVPAGAAGEDAPTVSGAASGAGVNIPDVRRVEG
jgi:hypothetical protein